MLSWAAGQRVRRMEFKGNRGQCAGQAVPSVSGAGKGRAGLIPAWGFVLSMPWVGTDGGGVLH